MATRLLSAVAGVTLLCVAAIVLAQGGNSEWHASVMMQLQQLGLWNSGALAGKASLVTKCAQGVDSACDALVNDPGAVAAMQHVDAKNPHGFAAKHPHKSAVLQRKLEIDHPSLLYPPAVAPRQPAHRERELLKQTVKGQEEHRVPEPLWAYKKNREAAAKYKKEHEDAFDKAFGRLHVARRVSEPLSYYGKGFQGVEKDYKTAPSTKEVWKLPAWKDGALGGGNTQWLKACAEGNYYACGKIEKSNDDIHDALLPQRDAIAQKPAISIPQPVYVAPRKPSLWSQLMSAVGLGDSFYHRKQSEVLRSVPKMLPDSGLVGRGHAEVYNDGTVGFLSDQ